MNEEVEQDYLEIARTTMKVEITKNSSGLKVLRIKNTSKNKVFNIDYDFKEAYGKVFNKINFPLEYLESNEHMDDMISYSFGLKPKTKIVVLWNDEQGGEYSKEFIISLI